jgi:hypothetical protein
LIEILELLAKEVASVLNPIEAACHSLLVISKGASCPFPKIYLQDSRVNNLRDGVGDLTRASASVNGIAYIPCPIPNWRRLLPCPQYLP